MKKAIILQISGDKYISQFETSKKMFENYASLTKSDLIIHKGLFDKANKRSFFAQRMLIPTIYKEYDQILCMDLDILISKYSKNIFEECNNKYGFAAIPIPRGKKKWVNTVINHYKINEILKETNEKYFEMRGYDVDGISTEKLKTINGGVLLFQPKIIGSLFEENYFSDFFENQKNNESNRRLNQNTDEAFMTYLAIKNNIFLSLSIKYNSLILYNLNDYEKIGFNYHKNKIFKFILRFQHRINFPRFIYPIEYQNFVRQQLENNYFVHFAGGFPYRKLNISDLIV